MKGTSPSLLYSTYFSIRPSVIFECVKTGTLTSLLPAPSSRRWSRHPPSRAAGDAGKNYVVSFGGEKSGHPSLNATILPPEKHGHRGIWTSSNWRPVDRIACTYVLGGLCGVDARAVEEEAHGVGLQRLAGAERVEDLAGSAKKRRG